MKKFEEIIAYPKSEMVWQHVLRQLDARFTGWEFSMRQEDNLFAIRGKGPDRNFIQIGLREDEVLNLMACQYAVQRPIEFLLADTLFHLFEEEFKRNGRFIGATLL